MAHKKAGGSSRNGRDSAGRRLGVKKFGGEIVIHKFKNKTGYHKRQGHRQPLTRVKVTGITVTA